MTATDFGQKLGFALKSADWPCCTGVSATTTTQQEPELALLVEQQLPIDPAKITEKKPYLNLSCLSLIKIIIVESLADYLYQCS